MRFYLLLLLLTLVLSSTTGRSISDSKNTERQDVIHRQKRGLFPSREEFKYFQRFFKERTGSSCEFEKAIYKGRIENWGKLFGKRNVDYAEAIKLTADYYLGKKKEGKNISEIIKSIGMIIEERIENARKHNGSDREHQRVIDGWRSVQKSMTREDVMPARGVMAHEFFLKKWGQQL